MLGILDADGTMFQRLVTGNTVKSERKTAGSTGLAITNLLFFDSVKVNGGFVEHIETIVSQSTPRRFSLRDIDAQPNLTLQPGPAYKPGKFSPRLVAGSGRYYVYGVGTDGDLSRYTRFATSTKQYYYSAKTIVAHNMGGLRSLSYYASYQIAGKWTDILYGTTSSGGLKQLRIAWSAPKSPSFRTEATTGFTGTTGLSLSNCNDNDNYLSVIAINRSTGEARWFTKAGVLQSVGPVVDRGPVQPDADWHVHATF